LRAIIPWEGLVDLYRDAGYHGGILSNGFLNRWHQGVLRVQHGTDGSLSQEECAANRAELLADVRMHPLVDAYYRTRMPDLRRINEGPERVWDDTAPVA
jgi:predicted acyl esterase